MKIASKRNIPCRPVDIPNVWKWVEPPIVSKMSPFNNTTAASSISKIGSEIFHSHNTSQSNRSRFVSHCWGNLASGLKFPGIIVERFVDPFSMYNPGSVTWKTWFDKSIGVGKHRSHLFRLTIRSFAGEFGLTSPKTCRPESVAHQLPLLEYISVVGVD